MKITRDSRKFVRARAKGLLRYTLESEPSHSQLGNIREVSEGGLSFLTYSKIPVGTKLNGTLLLPPRNAPFEIQAVIARCTQKSDSPAVYQTGVLFLDMSDKDRAAFKELLTSFLKIKKNTLPLHFVVRFNAA
jgi:hypothetical protein